MVSQISQKIDTFFEEAQYPWTASQPPPQQTANEASPYLQDLIDYVSTVMMSVLVQLPEFAKDYVYRGALNHCAMILQARLPLPSLSTPGERGPLTRPAQSLGTPLGTPQSYLTDREPRQVSDAGLLHLARDVRWLVNHVTSFQNERLSDAFSELQQVRSPLLPRNTMRSLADSFRARAARAPPHRHAQHHRLPRPVHAGAALPPRAAPCPAEHTRQAAHTLQLEQWERRWT